MTTRSSGMMWARLGAAWIWAWLLAVNVLGKRYVLTLHDTEGEDDDEHRHGLIRNIMSDVSKTAGLEITSVPAMRAGHFLLPVQSGLKIRLAVF